MQRITTAHPEPFTHTQTHTHTLRRACAFIFTRLSRQQHEYEAIESRWLCGYCIKA